MAGDPYRIAGSSYARDRLQVRTIVLVFIVPGPTENEGEDPWETIDSFTVAAPLGLIEIGRSAPQEDNGDFKLSITFEGVVGDGALGALLEYDNSSVDSPIQTFGKFDLLAEQYKALYDSKKQFTGWDPKYSPETGASDSTAARVLNPLFGTSHFLESNSVLRVTFITKDFHPEFLANLCKIQTPQVPAGVAKDIPTPEGKTWLYKSFKAKFRGNCWENEREYWLGRWVPDIYNPTD